MATGRILFTAVFSALTLNAAFADNSAENKKEEKKESRLTFGGYGKADLHSEDMARLHTAETSSVTTISDTPMRKTIPEKVTADLTFHMLFSMWDMTLAKDGRWVVKSSSSTEELKAPLK